MLAEIYRLAKPILFQLDAESAHRLTLAILATWPIATPSPDPPELRVKLWGREFSNPIGLAAGMDKDAVAAGAWQALGFGFAEFGTVTPLPQRGNPRPRIFRLIKDRALINRLGFPGDGMEVVARRIARIRERSIALRIGINIGPNKETAADRATADYAALAARMAPLADFVVINASSPNTPGLRDWQAPDRIRAIVAALKASAADSDRRAPILLKIAPDMTVSDLDRICETALDLGLDGIVATNTTLGRRELNVDSPHAGGLSGAPLFARTREFVREIRRATAGRLTIIGVGGVSSAENAWDLIGAGASLVELYTALIFEGPGVVAAIKAGLVALLRRDGFSSISDAVGFRA